MRDIYVRHRPRCRYSQADYEDKKGRPPRLIFGCGCPIYARVEIRDPVTKDTLFQHNGSLKGITSKEAAEELVTAWFVKYLSGEKPPAQNQKPSITVQESITRYLEEKKGAQPPPKPVVVSEAVRIFQSTRSADARDYESDSIRKVRDVLAPLVTFMAAKAVTYLKDVKTEHLVEFQQTWKGRRVKRSDTGEMIQLPKSQHGRAKYQEYVKMFFKRCRRLRWIEIDPAELLQGIRVEDPAIKVYAPEEKKKLLDTIPQTFPKKADMVRAFVLVQRYSALRISDTVALEVGSLTDSGVEVKAQRKTDAPVSCALPPMVVAALRSFEPKSAGYFFWTGNGQLETACKDWSATLLKLFRAAGVPEVWQGGKRCPASAGNGEGVLPLR